MGIPIFQVDAFTAEPFKGNPAGVCLLSAEAGDAWMQSVAREMNDPETAFLRLRPAGGYDLRWFTPATEVKLCGHATLAAAHILYERGLLKPDEEARFHTQSGLLTAVRGRDGLELNFPARPLRPEAPEWLRGIGGIIGAEPVFAGLSLEDAVVELESEAAVRAVRPDLERLRALPARAVAVTSRASTPGFDFVSRFFAPAVGVDEDPVTGSAHCALTPYWAERLGKTSMTAYQASARGGVLKVRLEGERVILAGQAVTVFAGELLI